MKQTLRHPGGGQWNEKRIRWQTNLCIVLPCLILSLAGCAMPPPDQAALESEVVLAEDLAKAKGTEAALLQALAEITPQPTTTLTPTFIPRPAPTDTSTPTLTPSPTPTMTSMPTPTPEDLRAVIVLGDEAMNQLRTLRFSLRETLNFEEGDLILTLTIDGAIENPDRAYMTLGMLGESAELLVIGDQLYRRPSGNQEWELVPEAEKVDFDFLAEERLASLNLFDLATDLKWLPDEILDGIDCYHIGFTLDVPAYFAMVMSDEAVRELGPVEGTGHGELWQGKADNLCRKLTFEMAVTAAGERLSLSFEALVYDFNQSVEIPQP